jgi:hypothetical protein
MGRERLGELFKEASAELGRVYGRRSRYLSGDTGAHALLRFSRLDDATIRRALSSMDGPRSQVRSDFYKMTLIRSPCLLTSHPATSSHAFRHLALDTSSGEEYDLSYEEQRMLEVFVQGEVVTQGVSRWMEAWNDPSREIQLMGRAFLIVKEFLAKGLLVEMTAG